MFDGIGSRFPCCRGNGRYFMSMTLRELGHLQALPYHSIGHRRPVLR